MGRHQASKEACQRAARRELDASRSSAEGYLFFLGGTTASLNALAKRNLTTVLAGILMASLVCGLRPMRSLRWALTALPRPVITNMPLDSVCLVARFAISSN